MRVCVCTCIRAYMRVCDREEREADYFFNIHG